MRLVTGNDRAGIEEQSQSQGAKRELRLFIWAIGGSVVAHSALLLMLLNFQSGARSINDPLLNEKAEAQAIAVQFIMQNPLRFPPQQDEVQDGADVVPSESSNAAMPSVAEPENALPDTEPASGSTPLMVEESATEEVGETPGPEQKAPMPAEQRSLLIAPSVAMMRDSIQRLDSQSRAQSWRRQCNPLQEESELLDCAESPESDYSAATENVTYRALNPVFTLSRSQRSVPVIESEFTALEGRLDTLVESGELSAWLGDHVTQQIDRGISDESGNDSRVVDHMIQMTDKSEAAQRARIMFGDAWLQNTMREAARRDVHRE